MCIVDTSVLPDRLLSWSPVRRIMKSRTAYLDVELVNSEIKACKVSSEGGTLLKC